MQTLTVIIHGVDLPGRDLAGLDEAGRRQLKVGLQRGQDVGAGRAR